MSNHVHLLIETSTAPLSKIMQSLHTGYTQYFNLKYHKAGHLFQGRYKAIVCEKDSYLLQLVRYIHQNPLRASIVENLEGYPWSSHHAYTGTKEYVFLDTNFVLSLFGHTSSSARAHYLRFMNESDDNFSAKAYLPVLGDEPFIDKIVKSLTLITQHFSYVDWRGAWIRKHCNMYYSA